MLKGLNGLILENRIVNKDPILDFSKAKRNKDGLLCITKFHPVENVVKEPILDCRHKMQKECRHCGALMLRLCSDFWWV